MILVSILISLDSMSSRDRTLRPRQNGRHFTVDTFKRTFLNENVRISIKISLKFVPKGQINNVPALVQRTAWRRPGTKPLSEPMLVRLRTRICVTWPQWVKEEPNTTWSSRYEMLQNHIYIRRRFGYNLDAIFTYIWVFISKYRMYSRWHILLYLFRIAN